MREENTYTQKYMTKCKWCRTNDALEINYFILCEKCKSEFERMGWIKEDIEEVGRRGVKKEDDSR